LKRLPSVIVRLIKELPAEAHLDTSASSHDNFRVVADEYTFDIRTANKEKTRFYVDTYNNKTLELGKTLNLSISQFSLNMIIKLSGFFK
jgi:hypothetical protein